MTDQQIGHIIEYLAKDAVGLAFLGFVAKWILSKWLEDGTKLRKLEVEQAKEMARENKEAIGRVQDMQVALRAEFASMKERLDLVMPTLTRNTERFVELATAFKGYVENTNRRLEKVETSTAEVIKVGKEIATRVATKKPPTSGSGG